MNRNTSQLEQIKNTNQLGSFEKIVMNNLKQSIQKHLSLFKIDQGQLNYALFITIDNFKIDQHSDQCLIILLRHKANPNCQFDHQTPLTFACRKGQQLIVKTLIEYGAKPDLYNKKGQHPLAVILSDKRQNYDIAQVLINVTNSVNFQIDGIYPIIIAVQRQFLRIFQLLVQKGALLIYENETILHIIIKKRFKKLQKKKKFIKQLAGRYNLIQQDNYNKLPIQYEQNEQIKIFIMQQFKQKILKQQQNKQWNKILKQKQQKQKNKQLQTIINQKQIKKKSNNKDLQTSLSQIDEQEYQDQKNDQSKENKLKQIVQSIEEEDNKQKKQDKKQNNKSCTKIQIISNKCGTISKRLIQINNGIKQNQLSKQHVVLIQCKQQQKQKIKKKLCNLTKIQKKNTIPNTNNTDNLQKKRKKLKPSQQPVPSTKQHQKKKLQQDEILKQKKQKNILLKKNQINKKQSIQNYNKQKNNINNLDKIDQKQKNYFDDKQEEHFQFTKNQQDNIHLQEEIKQEKIDKESQISSEQSFQSIQINLNDQIYQFVNQITIKSQQKIPIIQSLLKYLQQIIKKQLSKNHQDVKIQLYIYGSQSVGLCIEESDVDVLVVSECDSTYLMKLIQDKGVLDVQGITEVKFIKGASMPVIKIQTNGKFEGIRIDMTFQSRNHMGLKCAQMIKAFMLAEPLLRPLTLVIKVLVKIYGLNNPYKGGISSYGITLMVIALLQFTEKQKKQVGNVGELLLNFLYFYGEEIDYITQAIIIHELGLFGQQPVYCIYRLPYFTDLNPKLVIYDPLNPVNNVGRTTYRIAALKKLFSVCYLRFKQDQKCKLKDILDGSFGQIIQSF